jgi:hypothetical protein
MVYDWDTEKTISWGKYTPIVTNPFEFPRMLKNWIDGGIQAKKYSLKIIESDVEFNNTMEDIFRNGCIPIVNPLIGADGNSIEGRLIYNWDDVMGSVNTNNGESIH